MINRYSRQMILPAIGPEGQKKLGQSYAVVIGCGALGTVIASGLARSGIGKIRIIDRDFIEYHNLQRQILFDEDDIKGNLPKAIAAERHLKRINSTIEIEGLVSDVNYSNIEKLVEGADIILDGLDNLETRLLINDVAVKHNIPWIYGGAIAMSGMTMNIIPRETACYRCINPGETSSGQLLTCETAGVLGPAPWIIASLQVTEALKILLGAKEICRDLVIIDVWNTNLQRLKVVRSEDCPACRHQKYEFLEGKFSTKTTSLCGQNAVQVLGSGHASLSLADLANRLRPLGEVKFNSFMLVFNTDSHEMMIFPDGRAIIKNTNDEAYARGLYSKYVGA
jgi:molybdopterin-synthase adenylyltransferase